MAILTGAIKYRGSFKSIRNYVTLHDSNVYAGEKGGANKDLIKNNPAFVRTRENMNEFNGCGAAVKAIRRGLLNLLPEQTDKLFTARLMKIVKGVNLKDFEGIRGKRSITFSGSKTALLKIVFSKLQHISDTLQDQFVVEHPITRISSKLTLTDFTIKPDLVPSGAKYYRVQHHLSIISDYEYSEVNRQYDPLSDLNGKSTFAYSDYTPVGTNLTDEIVAAFPVGTTLGDADNVIECVGVEFYQKSGTDTYLPFQGRSIMVVDVF